MTTKNWKPAPLTGVAVLVDYTESKELPDVIADDEIYLDSVAVGMWLSVSPSTLKRWVRDGFFPPPFAFTGVVDAHGRPPKNATRRWRKGDIKRWLEGRPIVDKTW